MTAEEQIKAIMKNRFFEPKQFPKNFKIKQNLNKNIKLHTQTWPNCWMFAAFNNTALDHGIYVDETKAQKFLWQFWMKLESWGSAAASSMMLAEYMSTNLFVNKKDFVVYSLDILTQTKIFAEMLKAGRWFIYSRDCSKEVLQDIADNDVIDLIHKWTTSPHVVNIWWQFGVWLQELWNWGDENKYNDFRYKDPLLFVKLVRSWMIERTVLFISERQ